MREAPGQGVAAAVDRSEHDAVEFPNVVVFRADLERARLQPHDQECGLIQRTGELTVAEVEREIRRAAAANGGAVFDIALPLAFGAPLEEALAGLDEGRDFGFLQSAAIKADLADFAIEACARF